jgi:hypothetical protein
MAGKFRRDFGDENKPRMAGDEIGHGDHVARLFLRDRLARAKLAALHLDGG